MKISKKQRAEYHKAFLELRELGPRYSGVGICLNCGIDSQVVGALSEKWPRFSGDISYPIPSSRKGGCPEVAYHGAKSLWNKRTKYGRLRWELLDFLIDATKPEDK
jgi:hypothetical protein